MSWPYVAQDPNGGWYADCEGVMQDPDRKRTQVEAMQWCIDRLASKLGSARHGCDQFFGMQCLLHKGNFDENDVSAMRDQLNLYGLDLGSLEWSVDKSVRVYEHWITQQIKAAKQ